MENVFDGLITRLELSEKRISELKNSFQKSPKLKDKRKTKEDNTTQTLIKKKVYVNKEIYSLEDKKVLSRIKRNICMMKMHDYSTQYHFNIYTPLPSTIKKN